MREKYSDFDKRKTKVEKLKEKIRNEIKEAKSLYGERLDFILKNKNENSFLEKNNYREALKILFYLERLDIFLDNERAFMDYIEYSKTLDYIIYKIPIKDINVWLNENFNFIDAFLYKLEKIVQGEFDDSFFSCNFLTLYDYEQYGKEDLTW